MPRMGGGGSAMMKASWMLCRLPNSLPMILSDVLAVLEPFLEALERREDDAGIAGVGECRAVEAGKGDGVGDARRLADDIRRLLDDGVGAGERSAVRQLDDDDGITLVHASG